MTLTRRTMLVTAGAAATLPFATREAHAATLRYAHVGSPGDVQTRFADELAALAKQKSSGRLDVRIFGKPNTLKNRRMAVALARAQTVEAAVDTAVKAASRVALRYAGDPVTSS